jgi:hypothetical protein
VVPQLLQAAASAQDRHSSRHGSDVVVRHLLSHGASRRTTYLQGISSEEIISTVHARRPPMMHASAGLDL